MRTAVKANPRKSQVSVTRSIPAPVGGWDAQNALQDMPAQNAPILDNWIPRAGYVEMRKGFADFATTAATVESLIAWRGASEKLYACSGALIQDVTTGTPSTKYSSASNARWQYVDFANDAGTFAICVNGANTPQKCDGSTFADLTITGSSGSITLSSSDLIDVMAHHNRLFFVEKNSLRVWFLGTQAISGTAQLLDLGPVFQQGGTLIAMGTWSVDGGQGTDDLAVFATTQGEIAIYQGTDPSDATNWSLVGVYSVGTPLGRRALLKYGADLCIVTSAGVIPLSQALKLDRAQDNDVALTALIQNAFAIAAANYSALFGWEGVLYQTGALAIFNVPTSNTTAEQYVQNVQTGAWCRFTGLNARCWAILNGKAYFGTAGGVKHWDVGAQDGSAAITADMQGAFNYFGSHNQLKAFQLVRPTLRVDQGIVPALDINTNFRSTTPTNIPTTISSPAGAWDTGKWDDAVWADGEETRFDWTGATGIGVCGAARMIVKTQSASDITVQVIGFDVVYQNGGVL